MHVDTDTDKDDAEAAETALTTPTRGKTRKTLEMLLEGRVRGSGTRKTAGAVQDEGGGAVVAEVKRKLTSVPEVRRGRSFFRGDLKGRGKRRRTHTPGGARRGWWQLWRKTSRGAVRQADEATGDSCSETTAQAVRKE